MEYVIGEDSYEILFSVKENTFIYETELKKGNKFIDNIVKEDIDQNIIPLYDKMDIFIEALKKNNENDKIELLYEETISLYEKKKKFGLLLSLFLKTYDQNKNLCSKLINTFRKICEKENSDRDQVFANQLDTFNQIYSNADDIIRTN